MSKQSVVHRAGKYVQDNYPMFFHRYLAKPVAKFRYRNEVLALQGKHVSNSNHPSFFFFTTHKCASVFILQNLARLAEDKGMEHIHLEAYFGRTDHTQYENFLDSEFASKVFKPTGFYFGPFRERYGINPPDDNPILLILRDPRDVLTSYYYSVSMSHGVLHPDIIQMREEARQTRIDDYVIRKADMFFERYLDYANHLLSRPNTLFLRYEDMVVNFEEWLYQIAEHLHLQTNQRTIDQLVGKANFDVSEDVKSHKRQVMPGDHRRKLRTETIAHLNEKFTPIFSRMGYE